MQASLLWRSQLIWLVPNNFKRVKATRELRGYKGDRGWKEAEWVFVGSASAVMMLSLATTPGSLTTAVISAPSVQLIKSYCGL